MLSCESCVVLLPVWLEVYILFCGSPTVSLYIYRISHWFLVSLYIYAFLNDSWSLLIQFLTRLANKLVVCSSLSLSLSLSFSLSILPFPTRYLCLLSMFVFSYHFFVFRYFKLQLAYSSRTLGIQNLYRVIQTVLFVPMWLQTLLRLETTFVSYPCLSRWSTGSCFLFNFSPSLISLYLISYHLWSIILNVYFLFEWAR